MQNQKKKVKDLYHNRIMQRRRLSTDVETLCGQMSSHTNVMVSQYFIIFHQKKHI